MPPIQKRLKWAMQHGRLTVADMTLWFQRAHATVRNWVLLGVEPRGPRTDTMLKRLSLLEHLIRQRRGFPVPDELNLTQRPAYLKKIRDGRNARLPRSRPSR